jgi:putative membrane protein
MFINYITLMLVNMVAGLCLLASFVYQGLGETNQKRWVPGFGMVGAIALATGLHTIWTWPLIGSFNIAYGEMSVLFGILFLGASIAIAQGWELLTVAVYGFFAGVAAVVVGARILNLGLTRQPVLSAIGFILTGLGGILAAPTLYLQANRQWRLIGAIVLVIAALIWAFTGYMTYWGHIDTYQKWVPSTMPK